jgi:hypothetical protein
MILSLEPSLPSFEQETLSSLPPFHSMHCIQQVLLGDWFKLIKSPIKSPESPSTSEVINTFTLYCKHGIHTVQQYDCVIRVLKCSLQCVDDLGKIKTRIYLVDLSCARSFLTDTLESEYIHYHSKVWGHLEMSLFFERKAHFCPF